MEQTNLYGNSEHQVAQDMLGNLIDLLVAETGSDGVEPPVFTAAPATASASPSTEAIVLTEKDEVATEADTFNAETPGTTASTCER